MSNAIETASLTRRFGKQLAVNQVSLQVPRHSVYGFLGRNGAGKSTTLKLILGLLHPDSGRVLVDGVDVAAQRLEAARRVGALLDAQGFYAALSGRENLELSQRLRGCAASEIARVLKVAEMGAHADRRVSDYSLGMRQRLGLARAMLGAPPVLILDEPTNGLDPEGMADMRRFLRSLPERTGATVLLSSHLLGEIEQVATHIGILSHGRLMLQGNLDDLRGALAPEIELQAGDPARAAELARAHGYRVTQTDAALAVHLNARDDPRVATAALARALCRANIDVHAIAPRTQSLERLYQRVAQTGVENLESLS